MQSFVNSLQQQINEWREKEYIGVYPETLNILKYINKVNFLRKPQKEALETYIFLKEIQKNKPLSDVCLSLFDQKTLRQSLDFSEKEKDELIDMTDEERQNIYKEKIQTTFGSDDYTNQVYALTMGTGKTVLMTVFMLYDIVLSYYYPEESIFAKNFLVFAPDKTIIESLKEIKSFDFNNVIPPEYHNALLQIKYHYLEDLKHTISVSDGSIYNIIVTNSQKIIIKTRKGNKDNLKSALLGDEKERESHQIENQRLLAIKRLSNLSIFIDEAHHSFGTNLEWELKKTKETINRIHENKALVNCVNMTWTPYIDGEMIPNVVYYYGLKEWIEHWILKEADIIEFGDVKSDDFLKLVISEFWKKYAEERIDGKLPKIAIYTANIEELKEVRQKLEKEILKGLKINTQKVVENHSEVSNEELQEFKLLDTEKSEKQFILLVNKWTEGRNCKSLFATALYRKPPQIFTLQSTARCLRAIGKNDKKATIFLSKQNYNVLDKELKLNFGIDIEGIMKINKNRQPIECTIEKRKSIWVKKIVKSIIASQQKDFSKFTIDFNKYKPQEIYMHIKELGTSYDDKWIKTIDKELLNKQINYYEILWSIYKNTHIDFSSVKEILQNTEHTKEQLEKIISEDNQKLWFIIDEICKNYYNYEEKTETIEEELKLIKIDSNSFTFEVDKDNLSLVCYKRDIEENRLWFHINPYNFDSTDELELFKYIHSTLDKDEEVKDVYFTWWTGSENYTDFFFQYEIYEEDEKKVKKYFPDFLVEIEKKWGWKRYLVIEVKGSDKREDYKKAQEYYEKWDKKISNDVFAKELWFRAFKEINKDFEYRITFEAKIPSEKEKLVKEIESI